MFSIRTITNRPFDPTSNPSSRNRFAGRARWGVAALGLLAATVLEVQNHGGGWLVLGFALMPDLGLLAGMARGLLKGQLAPRAVPIYNALHRFVGPAMLAGFAITGLLPTVWFAAALAWALHIAVDRTAGYELRGADGFQRQ